MLSVIIPSYKNSQQLIKNLDNNLKYLNDCQIIIVNDNPQISIKNILKRFKNILLIENEQNLGFGASVNLGVKKAKNNYLLFLNDDVILNDNGYLLAIKHFKKNPLLFAVSFAQKEKDGLIVGKNKVYFKKGLYMHQAAGNLDFGNNGWAEGGACLVDKEKFDKLGGFDSVYSPFYWEDIDLSQRAKTPGYQILFDPKILVIHHHQTTISKYYSKNQVKVIAYRNQFIFTWKNLSNLEKIISHLVWTPVLIIKHLIKGDFSFIKGFITALTKLPQIINNGQH